MVNMMMNEEIIGLAEDLVTHCNWCSCFSEEYDEFGKLVITDICPFLSDDEDIWSARCTIGDPTLWNLEEARR